MKDMQQGIVDGLGDDLVIRMCLAGQGQWVKLDRALRDAGFSRDPGSSGWPSYSRIKRLVDSGAITRVNRGWYLANCPHCHEPILNVFGTEH